MTKRTPLPRLPDGTIDWATVQREREDRHARVWSQLFEARMYPRGQQARYLRRPVIVRRE